MVTVVAGSGEGGGGLFSDIRTVIHFGDAVGPWVGDMGYVPAHWDSIGRIPPQVGPQVDGS